MIILGIFSMITYSLYVMACKKQIPYLKVGKLLRFDIMAIDNWLKEKMIKELY